ncbi:MAG: AMIN domain-containing protein [bacterium]
MFKNKNIIISFFVFFFWTFLVMGKVGNITNIEVEKINGKTIVKIISDSEIKKYNNFKLQQPLRLVIDFYETTLIEPIRKEINTANVSSIYSSNYQSEPEKVARVVLKLEKDFSQKIIKKENKLYIELTFSEEKVEKETTPKSKFDSTIKIETAYLPDSKTKNETIKPTQPQITTQPIQPVVTKPVATTKEVPTTPVTKQVAITKEVIIPKTDNQKIDVPKQKKQKENVEIAKEKPLKTIEKQEPIKQKIQEQKTENIAKLDTEENETIQITTQPIQPVVTTKEVMVSKIDNQETTNLYEIDNFNIEKNDNEIKKIIPIAKKDSSNISTSQNTNKISYNKNIGNKISFDFIDAEITNVLEFIISQGGAYPYIDESIKGKITLKMDNISWIDSLEYVVKLKNLSYIYDRKVNIIRIGLKNVFVDGIDMSETTNTLENEKKKQEMEELFSPIEEKIFTLSHAKAEEVGSAISNRISKEGKFQIISKTNSILIKDIGIKMREIEKLIVKLDKKDFQVMIEAKIIEIQTSNINSLGVDWASTMQEISANGSKTIEASNIPGALGNTTLKIGTIINNMTFNAILKYMEEQTKLKILSNPRISTMNNVPASMMVGSMIPYTRLDQSGNTVSDFVKVGISLSVKPTITIADYIIMEIKPEISSTQGKSILTTNATTTVRVKDGETSVIGGLTRNANQTKESKISFLEKFPIIGFLFRNKESTDDAREILIFVTPHIVRD